MLRTRSAGYSCASAFALTLVIFSACVGDPPSTSQEGSPDGSADGAPSQDAEQGGGDGSSQDGAASDSGSGTSDAGCVVNHLLVNEIRSRGTGGGSDEFIELFNPTATAVTLDSSWTLQVRGASDGSELTAWTGTGKTIAAHGYFLVGGSGYTESPAADEAMANPVKDASNLVLRHSASTVDVVCFAYSTTTSNAMTGDATFGCEGAPADNTPHNDSSTAASNVDQSLRRGHCVDTDQNADDFAKNAPATPKSTTSPIDP